ncbi:MAG: aminoacetone oxidase family FAD-binding enzyme, partial [Clostridia bacterium]|nr:aminoacetone oxidase family FAD-binding enzyme [Clostridia bacterium]
MTKVIIVGGGAAGLMAAGTAAERGLDVTVIERNDKVARKVMITGKGRCNVTNATGLINEIIENVPNNGRFLYSAFTNFNPYDTMDFFEENGVTLKIERGNRVFPESDKASDIVDALRRYALKSGANVIKGRVTELLVSDSQITGVKTEEGNEYSADAVVVATGGMSYPLTGSTGDGYSLAKSVGHTVTDLSPSLVPVEVHEGFCSALQGLSLKNVELRVVNSDNFKTVYEERGEMIFTHFGISGPMVLSASAHMKNMQRGKYEIYIDLKPALTYEQLDARLLKDFRENAN